MDSEKQLYFILKRGKDSTKFRPPAAFYFQVIAGFAGFSLINWLIDEIFPYHTYHFIKNIAYILFIYYYISYSRKAYQRRDKSKEVQWIAYALENTDPKDYGILIDRTNFELGIDIRDQVLKNDELSQFRNLFENNSVSIAESVEAVEISTDDKLFPEETIFKGKNNCKTVLDFIRQKPGEIFIIGFVFFGLNMFMNLFSFLPSSEQLIPMPVIIGIVCIIVLYRNYRNSVSILDSICLNQKGIKINSQELIPWDAMTAKVYAEKNLFVPWQREQLQSFLLIETSNSQINVPLKDLSSDLAEFSRLLRIYQDKYQQSNKQ